MKTSSLLIFATFASVITCGAPLAQTGTTFTGTFTSCAKADIGAVVQTVEGEVNAILATGGAGLEAALVTLATTVGLDTLECAIAAVEAAAATVTGTGSGSGSAVVANATRAQAQSFVRAKAWVAAQRAAGKK
jgi:hypothetical protein